MNTSLNLEEKSLIDNGHRIDAIKSYNDRIGCGFVLAKKLITEYEKTKNNERENLRKMNFQLNRWMIKRFG